MFHYTYDELQGELEDIIKIMLDDDLEMAKKDKSYLDKKGISNITKIKFHLQQALIFTKQHLKDCA